MSETFDELYQSELDYFRHSAVDFAERFPKIANRLSLSGKDIRDPHVERLIQAFAFLNARTRHKLDDGFPELANAMLEILYPHLVAPVPSMSILRFGLSPTEKDLKAGHTVATGTELEMDAVRGHQCRFRTCYPVQLLPLAMKAVRLHPRPFSGPSTKWSAEAEGVLRFDLATLEPGIPMAHYEFDRLRFYVAISNFEKAARLVESVLSDTLEVVISGRGAQQAACVLPPDCVRPAGLTRAEAVIPDNVRSFPGYRLLTEYFLLPQKFLFFDVVGITPDTLAQVGSEMQLDILLREFPEDLQNDVSEKTVLTGCTPVINLFQHTADGTPLNHRTTEYQIIPDARQESALEVHSITDVRVEADREVTVYRPFYSVQHNDSSDATAYWHATRRPGPVEGDAGALNRATEVYISLVNPAFSPHRSGKGTLYSTLQCFNRDLPDELSRQRTAEQIQFDLKEGRGPISEISCLLAPTPTYRRHMGRRNLWPLISQLSLNHLTLVDSKDALDALREILLLNDIRSSDSTQNLIEGLESVSSKPDVERVNGGFVRGTRIEVLYDDENFSGDSAFLFSLVLNHFFSMYTSINSFTKLVATTKARKLRKQDPWVWPAQSGEKALI